MPMSTWEEVAGLACQVCGGPATHFYGDMVICCGCHVGEPDGGIYNAQQARQEHARVLIQRAEGGE